MLIEIGTTAFGSINGCLAFIKFIYFSSLIIGVVPFMELEYLAFANIKSKFPIASMSANSSSVYGNSS